ncbi:hypothetical protein OPAG_08136 [Rhodococcus opacus PD630]|uniref:hypothetical protein n=1 Tax=Rhodococcus opacus TaxID=37919 RepID=UPI00029CD274|nr:hypothetical protein [Rhodococcus opacus]EHI41318.1 hypothetical protein OPAG_08136 [Rhodococcus opacus PD630]UDH01637.1 hypothetical protein K2Z90_008062 [Rhodococcus opacus PD630]
MGGLLEWVQTNGWVVTAIGIVIAATIAITLYFKNKKKKTLDFAVSENVAILSRVRNSISEPVTVRVGNHELVRPRLITIRYENTGNQEIIQDDFLSSLSVIFGGAMVISAQVSEKSDSEISVHEVEKEGVTAFKSDCLNAGDYFEVQYIVEEDEASESPYAVNPSYRIKGATRPPRRMDQTSTFTRSAILALGFSSSALGGTAVIILSKSNGESGAIPVAITIALAAVAALMYIVSFCDRAFRERLFRALSSFGRTHSDRR